MDAGPATDTASRPSRRRAAHGMALLALLALMAVAWSGCTSTREPAAPLTDEEAHARVAEALAAGMAALNGEATDGSLRGVTAVMGEGGESMTLQVDYGKDGVVRFRLGGMAITLTCADRIYLATSDVSLASRPNVVRPEGSCLLWPGSYGYLGSDAGSFAFLKTMDPRQGNVTQARDGTLHAGLEGEQGSKATVEVDPQGRIQALQATASDGNETVSTRATFSYGSRSRIDLPKESKLMPAGVDLREDANGSAHAWAIAASPQEPPLGELEVQLWDADKPYEGHTDAPAHDGRHALHRLDLIDGREQAVGNGTFRFVDADGDGRLSAGDSYEVRASDGNGTFPYDVILFDRLAGAEANSGFDMAPSPAWLVPAALAVGLAVLRRPRP